jgi:hypothetical protein
MNKIISVSGFIGSGKDSVADYLITKYNFKKMSFASTLKDAVGAVFSWDREMLDGLTPESRAWRDQVDTWWAKRLKIKHLTPRWVLQQWGTEVCRMHFHNDIWVASVENQLRSTADDIVITDSRFKNELKCIKQVGGTTIRVRRGPEPEWYKAASDYNKGPDGNCGWAIGKAVLDKHKVHASEYSSVGLKYDYHLTNDDTLETLYSSVDAILNQLSSRPASK